MRTSNLAYRIPVLVASVSLLAGCYTMLRHPVPDVTGGDGEEHDSQAYGSDCGSCHTAGFEQALLPDPYPYVAGPFLWFYEPPYQFPRRPVLVGNPARGSEDDGTETTVEDGRFVGSRGPGLSKLPTIYTPPAVVPSPPSPAATAPASPGSSPPPESGPQPGRTMKDDASEDTETNPDTKPTQRETIKDGSGG
jgi:hypothetical protein